MHSLREYAQFETLDALNEHISYILDTFDLNDTERSILWTLGGHSVKVLGVCWLKNSTLAEIVGKSVDTVKRALRKFVKLGIIKRIEQMRIKNGGNGASLTLLLPTVLHHREDEESTCHEYGLIPVEKSETIISKQKPSLNDIDIDSDITFIEKRVDKQFIELVRPFFKNTDILTLWRFTKTLFKNHFDIDYDLVRTAFKTTVFSYKKGRIRTKFQNYFYSVLRECIQEQEQEHAAEIRRSIFERESQRGNPLFVNWLD